jgi:hypothetical protein
MYLSVCAIYVDEAAYLPQYVEFHLLVGAERVYLYDNGSSDDYREVLAPYVERGDVVLYDWPVPYIGVGGRPSGTIQAFEHCLREHGHESRWIAFMDADEFLFSPTGRMLPDVLAEFEQWPAVCVNHVDYGPSGHLEPPTEGLVIENYTKRAPMRPDERLHYKAVVDPARTERCIGSHGFAYKEGYPVDDSGSPLEYDNPVWINPVSMSRLRINHYPLKSVADLRRKQAGWAGAGQGPRWGPAELDALDARFSVEDPAILSYEPALRRALEGTTADSA